MSPVTEIIVWTSPISFGITIWLVKEAYEALKGDVKEVKRQNGVILKRQERHELKIDSHEQKTAELAKKIDRINIAVHGIDKRTGDTVEMTRNMKELQKKLDQHESNYGKVMIILKKVVTIVKSKQD